MIVEIVDYKRRKVILLRDRQTDRQRQIELEREREKE